LNTVIRQILLRHRHLYAARFGIFEGVGHEVKQDLTDSGRIGEENRRNRIIGVVTEADTRSERFGRPEIRDGLQNITEVEVDILQLQPYPEHRSEAF
jgi:hypothetical protein